MKKILFVAIFAIASFAVANAQPRAIGGRLAYGVEASYQHSMGDTDFVEANLGLFGFSSLNATATYNFMCLQPDWTSKGEWGLYAGPGASVGFGWLTRSFSVAAVGQVGLEYTFWFPLQLSVDLRPQVGVELYGGEGDSRGGVRFNLAGLYYGFIPTLGVRYRF